MRGFCRGFLSVFIWRRSHPYQPPKILTYEEAMEKDKQALAGDWQKVGDDLRAAMKKVENERSNTN